MRYIILISALLAGCSYLPEESPFTFGMEECWYNEEGKATNRPCLTNKKYIKDEWHGGEQHNINDYKISYSPQHKYSTVKKLCKLLKVLISPDVVWVGAEGENGCMVISRQFKTATIYHVYGDYSVIRHEKSHIITEHDN